MVNLFLVFLQLGRLILELLLLFGQLHALGCTGMVNSITELGKLGAVTLLLLMHIVGAQPGEKIALIAVHIAQCLEAVLLAAVKEPVDRALLIGFQMVGIEVIQEVAADHLAGRTLAAERVGNKLEVFFQRIIAVDLANKLDKTSGNVIVKILVIADGNYVVGVRRKGNRNPLVLVFYIVVSVANSNPNTAKSYCRPRLIYKASLSKSGIKISSCVDKPIHVQRVAPEHTAHGIGNERHNLIPHGADIIAALHGLRYIVFAVKHAMYSNILVRHIRCQFILQAVDVDENAVQFFFVLFELLEAFFALGLPSSIFLGNQSSHINYPSTNLNADLAC